MSKNLLIKNKIDSLSTAMTLYEEVVNALFFQQSIEFGKEYPLLEGKMALSIGALKVLESELIHLLDDSHIVIRYIRDTKTSQEQLLTIINSLKGILEGSSYNRSAYQKDISRYQSMQVSNLNLGKELFEYYQTLL